jgi:4-aminobutyrate aminotransferase-like enzyme
LSPPLIVSEEQADYALDVLEKCISEVEKKAS